MANMVKWYPTRRNRRGFHHNLTRRGSNCKTGKSKDMQGRWVSRYEWELCPFSRGSRGREADHRGRRGKMERWSAFRLRQAKSHQAKRRGNWVGLVSSRTFIKRTLDINDRRVAIETCQDGQTHRRSTRHKDFRPRDARLKLQCWLV